MHQYIDQFSKERSRSLLKPQTYRRAFRGVIPVKYRELMSNAVALTTQCAYCIESHIENAVKASATKEELAETVFIASAIRAGGAVGNGLLAMKIFEETTGNVSNT
ncbi:carboxymuconolactone decarboxylase family protein [Algoriphagus aquimarinus]|uniref:carboxymuconolactone decarboxylase family protein n=1 Tax=Algoriphagus aquimarinus TaxID=237018 RepID=UPI001CB8C483|nr:carboxymuconolactone decarboxylase family protein [Algoriphagus aquimarinus]